MKVIVESGATKTVWCAIFKDGSTRSIKTDGVNLAIATDNSFSTLMQKAIAVLNPNFENITEIHVYAAGLVEPRIMGNVEYSSDLLGAARAVCGREPGIAAILGTGSNSCFFDGVNIVSKVRSGGFILGDEGSASCLGKLFISDYLKGMMPQKLAEEFASEFDVDYATIVKQVYKGDAPSKYLGSFAPWLWDRFDKDEYAHNLILSNFESFFDRFLSHYDTEHYPVGLVGGFAYVSKDILTEMAGKRGIRISRVLETPVEGLLEYHKETGNVDEW